MHKRLRKYQLRQSARALLAGISLLCCASSAAQSPPTEILAQCAQQADPGDVGVEVLEEGCPELWQALQDSGYADFISAEQYDSLDRGALEDLLALHADFQGGETAAAPQVSALAPILQAIEPAAPVKSQSLLQRVIAWLEELFKRQTQESSDSWWDRWLRDVSISERAARLITYTIGGLLLLIVIGVIVNELRVAGVFGRRKSKQGSAALPDGPDAPIELSDLEQLQRASLSQQPSLLLRMLVARLVATGRLRRERSLTHRELGRRAQFDSPEQREVFQHVASLAERAVYSGAALLDDEAAPVLAQGQLLHDALTDATAKFGAS